MNQDSYFCTSLPALLLLIIIIIEGAGECPSELEIAPQDFHLNFLNDQLSYLSMYCGSLYANFSDVFIQAHCTFLSCVACLFIDEL